MRSPDRPELITVLNHAVYTSVWSDVTPNSSMMTGLFALFCEVAWSEIHWLPQTLLLGSELWPQLSGYNYNAF